MLDIEDAAALDAYLRAQHRIAPSETVAIRTLSGGVSNRAVLVERDGPPSLVLKQALLKLRVAVDWYSDPIRIEREADGLRFLEELIPGRVPAFAFEDRERGLFAMSAVPSPHRTWKELLLAGDVRDEHARAFGDLLGTIHRLGAERRSDVARRFDDRSFFESLRVEPYYEFTARQLPAAAPFFEELVASTRTTRTTLVHGDYSPKNILIDPRDGRLILIDHEVIHYGDPGFDLGFAAAHLISKARHLPAVRAELARAAKLAWMSYEAAAGAEWSASVEPRAVAHTLGCTLARVTGRSQLEYLDDGERAAQRRDVLAALRRPPGTFAETVDALAVPG